MKKWQIILIVIVVLFFIIGAVNGHYNCSGYFCNTVTNFVNLICDMVKTEVRGITATISWISR